jgi:HSP20 family molecular chaperone IbpA
MSSSDPSLWMWSEARLALDRLERLHRRFFELGRPSNVPSWEPPADVFEMDGGLLVQVALPGVEPQRIQVAVEAGRLVVTGGRDLPCGAGVVIQRLEIPYGHFERHIPLPGGRYRMTRRETVNGCLILWLQHAE